MAIFEIVYLVISLIYFFFIFLIILQITKNRQIKIVNHSPKKVSILASLKDEEKNIAPLLQSLLKQNYPDFEIILINDHSSDETAKEMEKASQENKKIRCFHLNENLFGKKNAIEQGIKMASGEIILTTDADCTHNQSWIESHVSRIENGNNLVAGPVFISLDKSWFSKFQALEMMAIQTVSYGTAKMHVPISSSGANLSYQKSVFEQLNPYENNRNVLSGDDIYLLHSIKKKKKQLEFSMDTEIVVETKPVKFKEYAKQRIRWLKKSSSLRDLPTIFVGLLIFLASVMVLFSTVYQLITFQFNLLFTLSLGLKMAIDILLLFLIARKFKKERLLFYFLPSFFLTAFFSVFIVLFGWMFPVTWKQRKI